MPDEAVRKEIIFVGSGLDLALCDHRSKRTSATPTNLVGFQKLYSWSSPNTLLSVSAKEVHIWILQVGPPEKGKSTAAQLVSAIETR
jgi:hypothetical protein